MFDPYSGPRFSYPPHTMHYTAHGMPYGSLPFYPSPQTVATSGGFQEWCAIPDAPSYYAPTTADQPSVAPFNNRQWSFPVSSLGGGGDMRGAAVQGRPTDSQQIATEAYTAVYGPPAASGHSAHHVPQGQLHGQSQYPMAAEFTLTRSSQTRRVVPETNRQLGGADELYGCLLAEEPRAPAAHSQDLYSNKIYLKAAAREAPLVGKASTVDWPVEADGSARKKMSNFAKRSASAAVHDPRYSKKRVTVEESTIEADAEEEEDDDSEGDLSDQATDGTSDDKWIPYLPGAREVRTETGDRLFMCTRSGCVSKFRSLHAVCDHIKSAHSVSQPFQCPELGCGKMLASKAVLMMHIKGHTGRRPYACTHPGCSATFTQNSNLKRHVFTHTGERPVRPLLVCRAFDVDAYWLCVRAACVPVPALWRGILAEVHVELPHPHAHA